LTCRFLQIVAIRSLFNTGLTETIDHADNHSLQSLNLGGNCIGNKGAAAAACMLAANTALKALKLHGNEIGDQGATALSEALRMHNRWRLFHAHLAAPPFRNVSSVN
jgi:Ran GTPase-activating protein (RanGAP) involved in mRNA processing and transport